MFTANCNVSPPWQAELLQKRAGKSKTDSIPEWKKELLKRLHEKAEAARMKMAAEAKKAEEKLVVDEPILKVSDNIFMKKELQKKMSSQSLNKQLIYGLIKKDNVLVIEKKNSLDQVPTEQRHRGEVIDVELPSAGIVSRLKGKFISDDAKIPSTTSSMGKPLGNRWRSSDDILNIDNDAQPLSSLSPSHPSTKSFPHTFQTKRVASVESLSSRAFSHSATSESVHKSVKKMSKSQDKIENKVDLTSLHASGTPERIAVKTKVSEKTATPQPRPKLTDRTQEFTKDAATLHASSYSNKAKTGNAKDEIAFTPETITLSSPQAFQMPLPPAQKQTEVKQKSVDDVTVRATKTDVTKPLLSNNKENIPEVPKRRNVSITKHRSDRSSALSSGGTDGQGRIIELGRISMDPSMLKSEAAIAANEIMKESRTFMIVPRSKNRAGSDVTKLHRAKDDLKTPSVVASTFCTSPVIKSTSKPAQINNHLPTSSIDDVIAASEPAEASSVVISNKTKQVPDVTLVEKKAVPQVTNDVASVTNDVKSVTKVVAPVTKHIAPVSKEPALSKEETAALKMVAPTKKIVSPVGNVAAAPAAKVPNGRNFTINSSKQKIDVSRSSEKNNAANSLFGSKLNSSRANNKVGFGGGKSFVIDPSRFKKSSASAAPTTATAAKSAPKPSTANATTRVITPKSQPDPSAACSAISTDGGNSTPKGKRKLTVDQIEVIGGYVKLDHSSLAKPNKIRKGIRVKFEETHLESIFQYPSEASLLNEEREIQLNQKMASFNSKPTDIKENGVKVKDLLSLKDDNNDDDNDNGIGITIRPKKKQEKADAESEIATPVADDAASGFSASSSSSDLLF